MIHTHRRKERDIRLNRAAPTVEAHTSQQRRSFSVRNLAGATAGMLAVAAAVAAPAGAARTEPFAATCGGVQYTITSGYGRWSVGSDTASSTHFIPQAFSFTVTDEAGDVLLSETVVKKGHRNQETIT